MATGIAILDDIANFGIKDAFTAWAQIEQNKINQGFNRSQNQINEWNAQAPLLALQNETRRLDLQTARQYALDNKKWLIGGAVAVVVIVGFFVLRK